MGPHTTTTNTTINKTKTQNVNEHDTNTLNKNTNFDVSKTTNTEIDGNSVGGRALTQDTVGNAGLVCMGMQPGDPRCVMHLQNLAVETQPVEERIHQHVMNKMAHLRETNPTEYVQKLNALQMLI